MPCPRDGVPDGASNGAGGGVLRAAAMILRKGPLPGAKPVIDREEAKVLGLLISAQGEREMTLSLTERLEHLAKRGLNGGETAEIGKVLSLCNLSR